MKKSNDRLFAKSHFALVLMAMFLSIGYAVAADVKGKVTDEKNAALAGVTVSVKGKQNTVTTDAAGSFTINADENSVLVLSFVGFETQEVKVGNQTTLALVLREKKEALGEVVVVG